jgi:hypothetical protein
VASQLGAFSTRARLPGALIGAQSGFLLRCRELSKERHSRRFDRNGLADLFVSSCTSGKEAWKSTAQFRASVRSRSAFATSKR